MFGCGLVVGVEVYMWDDGDVPLPVSRMIARATRHARTVGGEDGGEPVEEAEVEEAVDDHGGGGQRDLLVRKGVVWWLGGEHMVSIKFVHLHPCVYIDTYATPNTHHRCVVPDEDLFGEVGVVLGDVVGDEQRARGRQRHEDPPGVVPALVFVLVNEVVDRCGHGMGGYTYTQTKAPTHVHTTSSRAR